MVSRYDRRLAKNVYRLYSGHGGGRTRSDSRSDSRGGSRSRGRNRRWRVAPAPAPTSAPAPSPAPCPSSCTALFPLPWELPQNSGGRGRSHGRSNNRGGSRSRGRNRCVRFHAPLQKPPHGLSGIVLAVPREVLVQEPVARGQPRTCRAIRRGPIQCCQIRRNRAHDARCRTLHRACSQRRVCAAPVCEGRQSSNGEEERVEVASVPLVGKPSHGRERRCPGGQSSSLPRGTRPQASTFPG